MKFAGSYSVKVKNFLTVSLVARQNAILLSKPGTGKTEMSLTTAYSVVGKDHTVLVELDPSSPTETVHGPFDVAALMANPPTFQRIYTDTPYDPRARITVLDEIFRASDPVFDALLKILDSKTMIEPPIVWCTANWVSKAERTEALRDRIGMWMWVTPDTEIRELATIRLSNGNGPRFEDVDWARGLPTWEECHKIWESHPSPRALEAVIEVLENLQIAADEQGFQAYQRRQVIWAQTLYRSACYYAGTTDFQTVPPEAKHALAYVMPVKDQEEAQKWMKVVAKLEDEIEARLAEMRDQVLAKIQRLVTMYVGPGGDPRKAVEELNQYIQQVTTEIRRLGHQNDPRVVEFISSLPVMYQDAIRAAQA